jgi:hypothetical protein
VVELHTLLQLDTPGPAVLGHFRALAGQGLWPPDDIDQTTPNAGSLNIVVGVPLIKGRM